ncbi:hypothetical protein ACFQZX_02935 [Mucilaginibacter litoreus]|uniref:Phage protein n=1 Tax=Mucilaginibacter litoreus TaxID=1048221 RepID=A0ABW3AQD3_9SPHI
MLPIYFTIGEDKHIKVIPNTQAQVNGHPVLTYTYNIYLRSEHEDEALEQQQEAELLLDKKLSPNYLGYITFEEPGRMFSYTPDGKDELTATEIEEIIENISHYRDHPGMWQLEE